MRGFERGFLIWAIVYMAIYVPVFLSAAATGWITRPVVFEIVVSLHGLGMVQNVVAIILTICDLYLRPFPHPNDKLTWSLLMSWTGGIGWLVYVFRHAIHPRPMGEDPHSIE